MRGSYAYMKILFLDYDGVILRWHWGNCQGFGSLDVPAAITSICRETGSKVVFTTARRAFTSFADLVKLYRIPKELVAASMPQDDRNRGKGYEIKMWLLKHPQVTRFCIVDDLDFGFSTSDILHDVWVQTQEDVGASPKELRAIRSILSPENGIGIDAYSCSKPELGARPYSFGVADNG